MTPQLIDKSKIYFYFFLLILLLSIHNLKSSDLIKNFFQIKKIILKSDIEENLNNEISIALEKIYNKNVFLIKSHEIKKILDKFNIISEYKIKKEYPSALKIELKETKILAYYFDNDQEIFIGENGKEIKNIFFNEKNLPVIEGNIDINLFFDLRNKLINQGYNINQFNKFYLTNSKRWNLFYKNDIIIKLPFKNIEKALKIIKDIISSPDINNIKTIDLRINNKIILS